MMTQTLLMAMTLESLIAVPELQAEPPLIRLVNGLAILVLLLISGICFIAFITVLTALLPGATTRTKAALLHSPWRAFFIGLANYLFLGGISLILLNSGPVAIMGLLMIALLMVVSTVGLLGLVHLTGEHLARLRGQDFSPWQQMLWGTVTLELAGLLPLAGWFVLTPILLMLSFGAAVLAWFNRKEELVGT